MDLQTGQTALANLWKSLVDFGVTWGMSIVGVLVALILAYFISRWLSRALTRSLEKRNFDLTLTRFFGALIRYLILGGAIIGCLGVFGIQTASFAAVIAAVGLAIGLALQGTLSNFAAGVMLLVFRPYKVGDLITVAGQLGVVEELQLFTTDLKTLDNRRLVVPNSQIFGQVIENKNHHPTRRVDLDVGVAYDADIDESRRVLETVPGKVPDVLQDPPPQIFLKSLGASSVDWQVRLWCPTDKYWDVYQAGIREIKAALDGAKLGIPFPQTDVHLDPEVVAALGGKRAA
jgi:small conductance mechanosensitive channel